MRSLQIEERLQTNAGRPNKVACRRRLLLLAALLLPLLLLHPTPPAGCSGCDVEHQARCQVHHSAGLERGAHQHAVATCAKEVKAARAGRRVMRHVRRGGNF